MKNNNKYLEASLLAFSKNEDDLISQLKELKKSGINNIHYDVMDGIFVSNKSFFGEHLNLLKEMNFIISVHLMVQDVSKYVEEFIKYDIDYLTFHCEPISDEECINQFNKIRSKNILCGIAIKPDTKIKDKKELIDLSDIITVMSVEPGKGGQKFIDSTIDKLKEIKTYNENVLIQIDGGINVENSQLIKKYVNFFIMGTFLIDNINESKFILNKVIG